MPASFHTEQQFVALFWRLALAGHGRAARVAKFMRPEMLYHPSLGTVFGELADRFARGVLQDDDGTRAELAAQIRDAATIENLYFLATDSAGLQIGPYAKQILESWRAERIATYVGDEAGVLKEMLSREEPAAVLKKAEAVMIRALAMQHEFSENSEPQSREEFSAAEREKVASKGVRGASWPYPKMQRVLGHLRPGKLYGISAYPGVGKSTVLANLFVGFARRGQPVLVAPTEMRDEWYSRALAAAARVPQEVAENELWDHTDPDVLRHLMAVWDLRGAEGEARAESDLRIYRENYLRTIDEFAAYPWEIVSGADLTIDDIIARFAILRRRFPGKFVIGMVDHMHNLQYPNGEVDKHVGDATRRLREFCIEDRDGGMACICLFQPRKPEKATGDLARYKPLPVQEVRGQVAQVLDVHLSVYRQFVKVDPSEKKTRWGTPAGLRDPETGFPVTCKPSDEDAKDDDEHIYLKPDKRRRHGGSRSNSTFVLDIDAETGTITERERHRHLQAV